MNGVKASPIATSAAVANLVARFAAAGFALAADDQRREWRVSGPGGNRTFHSMVEVEGFLDRQEGAA
ncbi:MAG: hypothetical protein ABIR54_07125 [Burkholderiaceae bacterium]